jgi:hypothetical protein
LARPYKYSIPSAIAQQSHSSIALPSRDLASGSPPARSLESVQRRLFSCVRSISPSMAVPVARVHLAMAHAAMPGLLPTPPQCTMLPLLPTPPCAAAAVILPDQSPPNNPGRADAVDRWDACKTTLIKSPPKPACRANAAVRWDARKITAKSSSGQPSSPDDNKKSSSASSSERWDINKKIPTSFSSTKWERTKRPVSRGSSSSSDERWDAHKKAHRPPQGDGHDDGDSEDDVQSSTGSNDVEAVDDEPRQKQMGLYAAPSHLAVSPPEPSLLPVPAFLVLPRFVAA